MSSPPVVVLSGLWTKQSKRVYNRLAVWAVTTVSLAIQERPHMASHVLHREILSLFNSWIDKCDVVVLCQEGGFRCDVPLAKDIANVKRLLKEFYCAKIDIR
jgi:hypothetical protein